MQTVKTVEINGKTYEVVAEFGSFGVVIEQGEKEIAVFYATIEQAIKAAEIILTEKAA